VLEPTVKLKKNCSLVTKRPLARPTGGRKKTPSRPKKGLDRSLPGELVPRGQVPENEADEQKTETRSKGNAFLSQWQGASGLEG